jgi:hypothetical protein
VPEGAGGARTGGMPLSSGPVDRNTLLWTLVVFFGASIMFGAIGNVTSDEGAGVRLLAQLGAGLILVGAIVLFMRRRR